MYFQQMHNNNAHLPRKMILHKSVPFPCAAPTRCLWWFTRPKPCLALITTDQWSLALPYWLTVRIPHGPKAADWNI